LAVQDEISRAIVNNLRLKLGRGRRRYETNAEAYDLYLRALASANRVFPGDIEVIRLFEKVIVKDPSFAPAYSGLAVAQTWRSFHSARGPDHDDALHEMRPAAERAIELDPLLAEAHSALGAVEAREGQWKQAEDSFRRAIAISPYLSSAHHSFARFVLLPLGRVEEAVREMRTAEENDPLSPLLHYEFSVALLSAGRLDEAFKQCAEMPEDALHKNECLGRARLSQGKTDEAIKSFTASQARNWGYLVNAYARARRWTEAGELISEAPGVYTDRRGAFQFALAFAGYGDKNRTIEYLERMAGFGPVRIGFTLNEPEFAFVRRDFRVQALRKKVGLPE
jgi:tetratricopeptide (TPR) repeat protein